MKIRTRFLLLVAASAVLVSALSLASGPGDAAATLPYQGRLERNGVPVNGSQDFEFSLYDDEDAAPGSAGFLWRETQTDVAVVAGAFATPLGSVTSLPNSVFATANLYLAVGVADPGGAIVYLQGLQALKQVPFAVRAESSLTAANATNAASASDLVPTGSLGIFGTWQTLVSGMVVTQGNSVGQVATTDGMVTAFGELSGASAGGHMRFSGRIDFDDNGTFENAEVVSAISTRVEAGEVMLPLTFPVKRGQRWDVFVRADSAGVVTLTVRFLPFGS